MTKGQSKTFKVLICAFVALAVIGVGLLVWEFHSIGLNDSATISETFWVLWAHQPGPIAFLGAALSFLLGCLTGHLLWQSADVYDKIRAGK